MLCTSCALIWIITILSGPLHGQSRPSHISAGLLRVFRNCSWCRMQLKVLVVTFKALHGIGSGHLSSRFSPMGLVCLTHTSGRGLLWILSAMNSSRRVWGKEPFPLWSHPCGIPYHQRWELLPPLWLSRRVLKLGFAGWPENLSGTFTAGDGWRDKKTSSPSSPLSGFSIVLKSLCSFNILIIFLLDL